MGNKKQTEVLDTIIDCLIINKSITKRNLIEETGLSYVTVKKWLALIQKIQELPKLAFDGKFLFLDMRPVEDVLMDNAIAFLGATVVDKETAEEEEVFSGKPQV
jgi:hypothetical protein